MRRGAVRRAPQIGDEALLGRGIGGLAAGEHMDARAGDRMRVGQRAVEAGEERRLLIGHGGKAAVGRALARRHVDERHDDALGREPRRHLRRGHGIGRLAFDAAKSQRGGGIDTVDERPLGKQHADVGGELGHGLCGFARRRVRG